MNTEIVKFGKDEIYCTHDGENYHVAINLMAKAIGLHVDSAVKGINNDPILSRKRGEHHVCRDGKATKKLVTLPIQYVNGWLFSLDIHKVKESIKPKLLEYKEHCYEVLYKHFHGSNNIVKDNITKLHSLADEKRKLNKIINQSMLRLSHKRRNVRT